MAYEMSPLGIKPGFPAELRNVHEQMRRDMNWLHSVWIKSFSLAVMTISRYGERLQFRS